MNVVIIDPMGLLSILFLQAINAADLELPHHDNSPEWDGWSLGDRLPALRFKQIKCNFQDTARSSPKARMETVLAGKWQQQFNDHQKPVKNAGCRRLDSFPLPGSL